MSAGSVFACRWIHDCPDEPVLLYSELDADRMEVRKIEVFADGRQVFADAIDHEGACSLSWVETPPLEEINADPVFRAWPITRDEFEALWSARSGPGDPHRWPPT